MCGLVLVIQLSFFCDAETLTESAYYWNNDTLEYCDFNQTAIPIEPYPIKNGTCYFDVYGYDYYLYVMMDCQNG